MEGPTFYTRKCRTLTRDAAARFIDFTNLSFPRWCENIYIENSMSVNYIAVDGLWRCLCPSIDNVIKSVATRQSARLKKRFPQAENYIRSARHLQRRGYGGASAKRKIVPRLIHAPFSEASLRADGSEVTLGALGPPVTTTGIQQNRSREDWETNVQLIRDSINNDEPQRDRRESDKGQLDSQYGGVRKEGWLNSRPLFPAESVGKRKASVNQSFKALRDRIGSLELQETRSPSVEDDSRGRGNMSNEIKTHTNSSSGGPDILYEELAQNDGKVRAVLNKLFGPAARTGSRQIQQKVKGGVVHDSLDWGPSKRPHREDKSSQAISQQTTTPKFQGREVFSKWIPPSPYSYDQKPPRETSDGVDASKAPSPHREKPWGPMSESYPSFNTSPLNSSHKQRDKKVISYSKIENWDAEELSTLHDRLRECWNNQGQYHRVVQLVEYLLVNRNEEPANVHFEALIRANTNAENGSAACVRALLEELREIGVRADSGLYHAALQVRWLLAILVSC
jgi:hypothetical protein